MSTRACIYYICVYIYIYRWCYTTPRSYTCFSCFFHFFFYGRYNIQAKCSGLARRINRFSFCMRSVLLFFRLERFFFLYFSVISREFSGVFLFFLLVAQYKGNARWIFFKETTSVNSRVRKQALPYPDSLIHSTKEPHCIESFQKDFSVVYPYACATLEFNWTISFGTVFVQYMYR